MGLGRFKCAQVNLPQFSHLRKEFRASAKGENSAGKYTHWMESSVTPGSPGRFLLTRLLSADQRSH